MIVSHQYRFIFIKTRKTAGTSLEVFLSPCCGPDDVFTRINPPVESHVARNHDGFFNHMGAGGIRERLGAHLWQTYFTFCVERNPWDKTLSYYHMVKARYDGNLSFDQYLASGDYCVDHRAYTEPEDPSRLAVDRVLRYEHLNEELAAVFRMLGVPYSGSLDVYAKSDYRTDRRPYREVYTLEQARLVETAFAREIALFGYSF